MSAPFPLAGPKDEGGKGANSAAALSLVADKPWAT